MSNPLDQFVVRPLWGNFKLGINTFTLDTILVAGVTFWLFYVLILSNKNLSHLYTSAIGPALKTLAYGGVVGAKNYRPLYVFLFIVILMSNLMGMIPFSLTSTSFAVTTFFFGISVFVGINIVALATYNWKFVNLFLPSGAPLAIAPFLIIIEMISYFARVMSLSIRLFANLLAGHALMKIIGGFVWTTPLIAAALVNSLRPVADTRAGLVESFQVYFGQMQTLWNTAVFEADEAISKADFWLFQHGVDMTVGVADAFNVMVATLSTFLIIVASVGSLLFVTARYFSDTIALPWTEIFASSKNSLLFKVMWIFYGFRAWILTLISMLKPAAFNMKREAGVWNMLLFVWAAFKYSILAVWSTGLNYILRGTTINTRVNFSQIATWNSYVAPIFKTSFWWVVIGLDLTVYFYRMLKMIGVAQHFGLTFTWTDVLSQPQLLSFGIFGTGIVLAVVLAVLTLGNMCWACCAKVAPNTSNKVAQTLSGPYCVITDLMAAVAVGLFAGWFQIVVYSDIFAMAYVSQTMPESLVYAALSRLGHIAPIYFIVFLFLVLVGTYVAELVSSSMDAAETRSSMKLVWAYAPALIAGLILMELLYWSLTYDIFFAFDCERKMLLSADLTTVLSPEGFTAFELYTASRGWNSVNYSGYISALNDMWSVVSASGTNPVWTLFSMAGSGLYAGVWLIAHLISTTVVYLVCEIDAILVAGLSSLMGLGALILLPLITPLAWSFLLAITFLELVIAGLQAYVFLTLSGMYLNDVIKLH